MYDKTTKKDCPEKDYPKLMISPATGRIMFFQRERVGTVLTIGAGSSNTVGAWGNTWDMQDFEDFEDQLILSNYPIK